MTDETAAATAVAAIFALSDESAATALLASLAETGVGFVSPRDPAARLALAFATRAGLADPATGDAILAARAEGLPIVPVLLEPMTLPADAPAALADALSGTPVIAYDAPGDERKRRLLAALALFGIGGGTAGVAEAGSMTATSSQTAASAAQTGSSAPVVKVSATAKTTAPVVKASSRLSSRTIAFGGAAAATILVVGAILIVQERPDRTGGAPASAVSDGPKTASTAPTEPSAPGTATEAPPPVDIATGDARVTLAQPSYPVGVPITVRVTGMPGHVRDYVAIAAEGTPGYGEVNYQYLNGKKDAEITLRGVMKPGKYEVRLFFGNDEQTGKTDQIRYAIPLTITPGDAITLTPSSGSVTEGHPVSVTFEGLPGNDKDWIAISEAGSRDSDYVSYVYTNGQKAGTVEMKPLAKAGAYEIRVYFDDLTSDRTVQARIPLTVTPAPPVSLQLDAATYAPGAPVTVTFGAMPGNQKDWLALGRAGEDGYLTYEYTGGQTSGTKTIRAPEEPGRYEIRAYFDDTINDRTLRATASFEVVAGP